VLPSLISGLVLGFCLAIPPGPINFAVFEKCVHGQRRAALRIILGAVTGHAFYCLIVIIYQLSTELLNLVKVFFSLAGGVFLAGLGLYYILRRQAPPLPAAGIEPDTAHHGHYLTGVLIALSNPFFIVAMIAVTEVLYSIGILYLHMGNNLMFILGFQLGTFGWLWSMGHFCAHHRHHFAGSRNRIQRYCGWAFLLFGLYMLAKFFKLLWF